ncbi:uncharacterized protein LOC129794753 [Lutzomyia longipalpis]|uniref:uncharacterized protein LOC129794753 n=1 Tax=Lutzomyia longipalpis TaxID=7200 RepID=UPI0024834C2C|nr:uncharacterized protein LOC129794753 [Lutzomyia longipalpis]XP_055691583.1 uncharacterized protein LOC129794753 [Lutzomyia longipalpis]XP_055691584.1 uncharacterized protein LOC129794753 [Lutzomyia longipalpis]
MMSSSNMEDSGVELLTSSKGKAILALDGYQYRIHRRCGDHIRWLCTRERKLNCRGTIKTDYNYVILSKIDHTSCVPDKLEIIIRKAMNQCKNRVIKELSTPVAKIYKEELDKFNETNSSLGITLPLYNNVKTHLCQARRAVVQKLKKGENIDMNSTILQLTDLDNLQCLSNMKNVTSGRKSSLSSKAVEAQRSWAFQCEKCGMTSKTKNDLVRHMQTVHLEKETAVQTPQKSSRSKVVVPVIKDVFSRHDVSSSSEQSSSSEVSVKGVESIHDVQGPEIINQSCLL